MVADLAYLKKWRENRWYDGKRALVLERDEHTCQWCGSKERLDVHHVDKKGRGFMGTIDNSMANLITLCKRCHRRLHTLKIHPTHLVSVAKYWDESDVNLAKMLSLSKPTIRKIRKMVLTKIGNGVAQFA